MTEKSTNFTGPLKEHLLRIVLHKQKQGFVKNICNVKNFVEI